MYSLKLSVCERAVLSGYLAQDPHKLYRLAFPIREREVLSWHLAGAPEFSEDAAGVETLRREVEQNLQVRRQRRTTGMVHMRASCVVAGSSFQSRPSRVFSMRGAVCIGKEGTRLMPLAAVHLCRKWMCIRPAWWFVLRYGAIPPPPAPPGAPHIHTYS